MLRTLTISPNHASKIALIDKLLSLVKFITSPSKSFSLNPSTSQTSSSINSNNNITIGITNGGLLSGNTVAGAAQDESLFEYPFLIFNLFYFGCINPDASYTVDDELYDFANTINHEESANLDDNINVSIDTSIESGNVLNGDNKNAKITHWEAIAAGFVVIHLVLEYCVKCDPVKSTYRPSAFVNTSIKLFKNDDEKLKFIDMIYPNAMKYLDHVEPRVRNKITGVIELLGKIDGDKAWGYFNEKLLSTITNLLEMDEIERAQEHERIAIRALEKVSEANDDNASTSASINNRLSDENRNDWPNISNKMKHEDNASIAFDHSNPLRSLLYLNTGFISNPIVEIRKTLTFSVICSLSEPEFSNANKINKRTYSVTSFKSGVSSSFDPSLLHETVGWKSLETSLRALNSLIRGCSDQLINHGYFHLEMSDESKTGIEGSSNNTNDVNMKKTNQLLDLVIVKTSRHQNRFVRELGYDICATLVSLIFKGKEKIINTNEDEHTSLKTVRITKNGEKILQAVSKTISKGLCDNWSEVRYTASIATRELMIGLVDLLKLMESKRSENSDGFTIAESSKRYGTVFEIMDLLIPRMCLNRHYFAEGVKLYSQDTWRMAFNNEGATIVGDHAKSCVEFYKQQCRSSNHVVRESSCNCITEISCRVRKDAVQPHVNDLINELNDCFKDESWQVRDAACLGCGYLVKGFPTEISHESFESLMKLWIDHLSDNIWSVREDSAIALGMVMETHPNKTIPRVIDYLNTNLLMVLEQIKQNDENYHHHGHSHGDDDGNGDGHHHSHQHHEHSDNVDNNDGETSSINSFGSGFNATGLKKNKRKSGGSVVVVDAKDEKYMNQPIFPCCSFGPKLKRGVGCVDHGFSKPKQGWEVTDGCIYLLRELAKIGASKYGLNEGNENVGGLKARRTLSLFQKTSSTNISNGGDNSTSNNANTNTAIATTSMEGDGNGVEVDKEMKQLIFLSMNNYMTKLHLVADIGAKKITIHQLNLLLETLWKQLPSIGNSLGKKQMKLYLDGFIPGLINCLESDNYLASQSATDSVNSLMEFVGESIFKGRVEQIQPDGERMWEIVMKKCGKENSQRQFRNGGLFAHKE